MDTNLKIMIVLGGIFGATLAYQHMKKRIDALQTQKTQLLQEVTNMSIDPSLGNNQYYVNQTKRQRIINETAQRVVEMSNTHVDQIKTAYDLDRLSQFRSKSCLSQTIYDAINEIVTNSYINSEDNEPAEITAAAAYMRLSGLKPIKSVFLDQYIVCSG